MPCTFKESSPFKIVRMFLQRRYIFHILVEYLESEQSINFSVVVVSQMKPEGKFFSL